MQHLLAAAAVGMSVSSCSKDEIRPEPAGSAAPPQPSGAASAVGQAAEVSTAAGTVDAGTDAGKTTKKPPPPPPPTGYRVVDPLPRPTRRDDKGNGF